MAFHCLDTHLIYSNAKTEGEYDIMDRHQHNLRPFEISYRTGLINPYSTINLHGKTEIQTHHLCNTCSQSMYYRVADMEVFSILPGKLICHGYGVPFILPCRIPGPDD